jgi:hypothetical protein
MQAGREMDALVAEKVMGVEIPKWLDVPNGLDTLTSREVVPLYSTDIRAAWQVVQNLRERGWFFDLGDKPSIDGDFASPRVWNAFVDRIVFGPNADTPMLAICLAALAAVEELSS